MPYKDIQRQRDYQNAWVKRHRSAWIASQGGHCCKCGETENLEVDHIDPGKKWTHRVWTYRKEVRERELRKCQILCRPCHQSKTAQDYKRRLRRPLATIIQERIARFR